MEDDPGLDFLERTAMHLSAMWRQKNELQKVRNKEAAEAAAAEVALAAAAASKELEGEDVDVQQVAEHERAAALLHDEEFFDDWAAVNIDELIDLTAEELAQGAVLNAGCCCPAVVLCTAG